MRERAFEAIAKGNARQLCSNLKHGDSRAAADIVGPTRTFLVCASNDDRLFLETKKNAHCWTDPNIQCARVTMIGGFFSVI